MTPAGCRPRWRSLPATISLARSSPPLTAARGGERLAATLIAFALAVGVTAHALDELHGRPLNTGIPSGALVAVAVGALSGSFLLGVAGIVRVGWGLAVFAQ